MLTGALEPARFIDSDAPFNLGMAVAALQTCAAGVYIVMNGHVFAAAQVRKNPQTNTFEALDWHNARRGRAATPKAQVAVRTAARPATGARRLR